MIKLKQLDSLAPLNSLKHAYLNQAVAPLDGMWLTGLVPQAEHFAYYLQDDLVGYYCVNDEGFVLQFYVNSAHHDQASKLFSTIFEEGHAQGAFVSTAEPQFLSYCLDEFRSFEVNALMYQLNYVSHKTIDQDLSVLDVPLKTKQLDEAISFAHRSIGAPRDWLDSYFHNLIARQELFGYWLDGQLIATGECRGYDSYQTDYADVGMIVSKDQRNKGIATRVLKDLLLIAKGRGLEPICSTESSNLAAQKAIVRAGFVAKHRILKFIL